MPKSSVRKNKKEWRSSKMVQAFHSKSLQTASLPAPLRLLRHANEVNMNQFKACLCRNDLKALVAEGEATAEQLAEAWTTLFYEYCDLTEATEVVHRALLKFEIDLYSKHNIMVAEWVKMLQLSYLPGIADAIKTLGFEVALDPDNPDQYQADLKRVTAELAFHKVKLRVKEAEYKFMMDNQSTIEEVVDEKYFSTIFFRINNYAKREAVNGMTTVEDYCVALKDYVEYVKAVNPKKY